MLRYPLYLPFEKFDRISQNLLYSGKTRVHMVVERNTRTWKRKKK